MSATADTKNGGADTEEQAIRVRNNLTETLDRACPHLQKRASSSNDIPDKLHENKELLLADNDTSVKTLGLKWHPVSDCFHDRCIDNLESMKPIGNPEGTANVIKPAKVSVVDFEAIPVVAGKIKNVAHVSHPDDKEKGSSGSQDLVR